jgi:hypothetical protein
LWVSAAANARNIEKATEKPPHIPCSGSDNP